MIEVIGRTRSGFAALKGGSIALFVALLLVGCTVRFVTDYDENIDKGLTEYQTGFVAFLSKMEAAAGTDAGKLAPNVEAYHQSRAKIEALITRAGVAKDPPCLSGSATSNVIEGLFKRLVDMENDLRGVAGADDVFKRLKENKAGSCTILVLGFVRDNQDVVQLIHARNDRLAPAVVKIIKPNIEQGVGIAIANETAKRRGQS